MYQFRHHIWGILILCQENSIDDEIHFIFECVRVDKCAK